MSSTLPNGSDDRNEKPTETAAGSVTAGAERPDRDDATGVEALPTGAAIATELLPRHRAELEASGLTDETVAANGVYSGSDPKAVAVLLNWSVSRAKLLGPVLVYPHFDRDGQPLHHATVKPDRPRDRADKPGKVKYENPRHRPSRLYVPAGARAALGEPTAPLMITEGCKKALAATQHGFPCVSLPGVWCWVAPREKHNGKKVGKLALNHDLAGVAWKGRRVYVCFDSDAGSNPEVARAEQALASVLKRHGAEVRVVRMPAEPDGAKNELDDFLARYGADRLRTLLGDARPPKRDQPVDPAALTESGYVVARGHTYHCVRGTDENGEEAVTKYTKLANFAARIVGETVTDDGAEQARAFAVEATRPGQPHRTAEVPVERFGALDWVVEKFGPTFVIQAGMGKRDQLRCAIQELSGDDIPTATVFTHTGWREIDGRWCYLHGGGAIVPGVPASPAVEVRLDGAAAGFRLPDPPTGDALRTAVRASLGILDGLVPDTVAFPLLATVYRAALGPADFALWLSGLTGAQKSELAALAQQHFGADMARSRLPGNWASTDNALEGLAFAVKDAILVIDDFAPPTCRADADRQHRVAERLIRGQGNSAGRQRMRADGTLRPPKPPRGLVLATGEDVPRGHSITARLGVVAVRRGDVNLSRLSACQKDAADGLYAASMAGFVARLAPRYGAVRAGLDAARIELRDRFVGRFPHARTPDIVANLLLGLRYLLAFAEDLKAIDRAQREELWRRGEAAFLALAAQQGEHQRAADPVARFPEMLGAVLSSGRGHLAGPDGKEPAAPPSVEAWGWEARVSHLGRGRKIGWVAGEEVYLDPDSAFAALSELAHEQGQAYPVTQQTLYRRLKESGALVRTDGDRTAYPVTLEGVRRRVLVLTADYLLGKPGQPGQPGRAKGNAGECVPASRPGFANGGAEPGHETGTNEREKSNPVPAVPVVPVSETGDGLGDTDGSRAGDGPFADDAEVFAP